MYFYPWGSKDLKDLIDYQTPNTINTLHGIPVDKRIVTKIFPIDYHHRIDFIKKTQTILLCHDQEPLNYDLYKDSSFMMTNYLNEIYKNLREIEVCPILNSNLRYSIISSPQKRWILLHSEKNSKEIEKYESTGRYKGAFWWSHAMLALDWYRYAEFDLSLHCSSHKKLFLIYSRAVDGTRKYRKHFLDSISEIERYCQIGSDAKENITSDSSAIYVSEDYVNTDISVVLETLFDDQRIHLTEKILRPIACGHPFILASGPNSLDFIRSYGFETFSPFINETYDTIEDHDQRLQAIITEMHRISNLENHQKNKLISECKAIALRNQKHFFSQTFFKKITEELVKNVFDASKQCKELDFTYYLETERWARKNQMKNLYSKNDRLALLPLIRHVRKHKGSFEQYQCHQHSLHDKSGTDGNDV
jgi:hypothetical protein